MVLNGVARQLALPAAVALAVVGDAEGYAHCEASGMGWVCIKLSVFHGGLRHPVTRNRCGAWAGAAGLQSISASRRWALALRSPWASAITSSISEIGRASGRERV